MTEKTTKAPKATATSKAKAATQKPAKSAASSKTVASKSATAAAAKTAAKTKANTGETVTIRQLKSGAGRAADQIATLKGLGLNKISRTKTLEDTPSVRGMIRKVAHLIEIVDAA